MHNLSIRPPTTSEKDLRVTEALALKDCHGVADETYKALYKFSLEGEFPNLSQVKRKREELSGVIPVTAMPDGSCSADFRVSLSQKVLSDTVLSEILSSHPEKPLELRFSCDGTGFKGLKSSSQVYGSYNILNKGFNSLTLDEIHPVTMYHGKETYSKLKDAFKSAVDVSAEILEDGGIDLGQLGFRKMKFYFSGDYISMLAILGLGGVSSDYPIVYCYCPKDKRHVINCHYERRTLANMSRRRQMKKKDDKNNCREEPVFWFIEVINCVIDVLHWLIRCSDILQSLLITELRTQDNLLQIRQNNEFSADKHPSLGALERQFRNMGVSFRFNITEQKKLVWTSLRATDRKVMCENLDVVALLGPGKKAVILQELFRTLSVHNKQLRARKLWSDQEISVFEEEARDYMRKFLSVFPTKHVTPYMHIYANHMGELLMEHRSLLPFIQEPIEKYNDVNKSMFFRSTDKKTASALRQVMQKQNRLMLSREIVKKYRIRHYKNY